MATVEVLREEFTSTLDHLERVYGKVANNIGRGRAFTFPDHHKLAEGVFLSSWTHWEEFTRNVLIEDLATDPGGFVQADVRRFRVKGAPRRMAEKILFHPDHPARFVEWDYDLIKSRADRLLSPNHRFAPPLPRADDLAKMKRIRNAIAHKSDRAWESFRRLVGEPPFNLQPNQLRGITTGRFLVSHNWNAHRVIVECFAIHRSHAQHLVP